MHRACSARPLLIAARQLPCVTHFIHHRVILPVTDSHRRQIWLHSRFRLLRLLRLFPYRQLLSQRSACFPGALLLLPADPLLQLLLPRFGCKRRRLSVPVHPLTRFPC